MNPDLSSWDREPPLVDETEFTAHAEPGWHAWNSMSPEQEFCDMVGRVVANLDSALVVETGTGQGFTSRRILANLPDNCSYLAYESDGMWRTTIAATTPLWRKVNSYLTELPTPDPRTISEADLLVLDSDWAYRLPEFEAWLDHGKRGSMVIVHDTGNGHPPGSSWSQMHRRIERSGIPGWFLPNPRGSFIGVRKGLILDYLSYEPGTVAIAYIYPGLVRGEFATSLAGTCFDAADVIGALIARQSGPNISTARNSNVEDFLASDTEWLFMVDTDMLFEADTLNRLLDAADPITKPIVGALCFARDDDGVIFPVMYRRAPDGTFDRASSAPEDGGVVGVDATGAACLLVHRSVFETIEQPRPWRWFGIGQAGDRAVGEDIIFCTRARQAGFPIYVDTSVQIGHVKEQVLSIESHRAWRKAHRYVITGTGRCGTGYLAALLTTLGFPTGHEDVYNVEEMNNWGLLRGDASWFAAPYVEQLRAEGVKIIHLVRDPRKVIGSFLGIEFFRHDSAEKDLMYDYLGDNTGNELTQAVLHYISWGRAIEEWADLTVRVEDLIHATVVADVLKLLGGYRELRHIQAALDIVPTDINTRPHLEVTWATLGRTLDLSLLKSLEEIAGLYGYPAYDVGDLAKET